MEQRIGQIEESVPGCHRQSEVGIIEFAMYGVQCGVCNVWCAMVGVHCLVCNVHCAVCERSGKMKSQKSSHASAAVSIRRRQN